MKQHMLTHKIRDMPQHMFDKPPNMSGGEDSQPPSIPREQQIKADPPLNKEPPQSQPPQPQPPMQQALPPPQEPPKEPPVKREMMETELPLPKRPPSKYDEVETNEISREALNYFMNMYYTQKNLIEMYKNKLFDSYFVHFFNILFDYQIYSYIFHMN